MLHHGYLYQLRHLPELIRGKSLPVLLAALVAASLPFSFRFTTFLLVLFLVSVLVTAILEKRAPSWKLFPYFLPWILYYLIYSAGYFYSEDKAGSLADLETKFSLFILPLILGVFWSPDRAEIRSILRAFVGGLTLFMLLSLLNALVAFLATRSSGVFYYHDLAVLSDANAVYISWYTLFSLTILLLCPSWYSMPVRLAMVMFQLVFFWLLSARVMQLTFLLVIVPVFLFQLHKNRPPGSARTTGIILAYIIVTSILLINLSVFNPRFREIRSGQAGLAFLEKYEHYDYQFDNLSNRLFFWRVGIENIREGNLFTGVGNGDVNSVQNQRMRELGIQGLDEGTQPSTFLNVNLHNMYLQTLLAAGIFALILLLSMLAFPFFYGLPGGSMRILLHLFLISAALLMVSESALQTQAGVVPFAFFSVLILNILLMEKTFIPLTARIRSDP